MSACDTMARRANHSARAKSCQVIGNCFNLSHSVIPERCASIESGIYRAKNSAERWIPDSLVTLALRNDEAASSRTTMSSRHREEQRDEAIQLSNSSCRRKSAKHSCTRRRGHRIMQHAEQSSGPTRYVRWLRLWTSIALPVDGSQLLSLKFSQS